jgi:ankyrin repeat protein
VQDGLTCLHLAVTSGSVATVRLLIAQGAEREAVTNVRDHYTSLQRRSGPWL